MRVDLRLGALPLARARSSASPQSVDRSSAKQRWAERASGDGRSASLTLAVVLVLATACSSAAPGPTPTVDPALPKAAGTPTALANASFSKPRLDIEVQQVFELNYLARTLQRGGQFSVDALRGLVGGAYATYTLPLFDREVRDAQAGILQQVGFKDIAARLDEWSESPQPGAGFAHVRVTRTREELRAGASAARETATYQFRMRRSRLGADGVAWVIYDFLNPATGGWISSPIPPPLVSAAQVGTELKTFFGQFYQARTLTSLHAIDLETSASFVAGSYDAYTMPLLEQSRVEAESGALKEVRYSDISIQVEKWEPGYTDHGGLATVAVTRTAYVTRPSGPEPPQQATYEFRVHRHYHAYVFAGPPDPSYSGPRGSLIWLVVDFVRPDVNRWVTDLAGANTIVPDVGHY